MVTKELQKMRKGDNCPLNGENHACFHKMHSKRIDISKNIGHSRLIPQGYFFRTSGILKLNLLESRDPRVKPEDDNIMEYDFLETSISLKVGNCLPYSINPDTPHALHLSL